MPVVDLDCIGPEGMKAFAECYSPFLRTLHLDGDYGMPFVASLLWNSKTMQELFRSENGIADTEPIADALSISSVLRRFSCRKILLRTMEFVAWPGRFTTMHTWKN